MIIIFYDNCTSFKKSKLTYKLILSKQKQDSVSNPAFWCLQRFIRSGLLTFFSSLVIQESLINFAGERLRNRMTSHCEIILSFCISAILVFSAQPFLVQFPILSSLMGSMLASCPFLLIVFLGFHFP